MENKNLIMGLPTVTQEQAEAFLLRSNPNYLNIVRLYYLLGELEGVRPDIALAQAIKETGYFKYGGDVRPEQNNFAGIGAVGGGAEGAVFHTQAHGVLAQIHHLKAYATGGEQKPELLQHSPRAHYIGVSRKSPYVEDLAGKWAVPGYNTSKYANLEAAMEAGDAYGHQIMNIVNAMSKMPVKEPVQEVVEPVKEEPVLREPGMPRDYRGRWSEQYFEHLEKLGILRGDGEGNFSPTRQVTREELAAVISRTLRHLEG
jgi:hypothetical protein